MTTYVLRSDGWYDKVTGEKQPFVDRIYDENNPFPLPRTNTSDDQEALQSMADGKWYTSKAKMRESYKSQNNPKGVTYEEVGDDRAFLKHKHTPLKAKKEDFVEAVEKAEAAINRGEFQ